MKQVYRHSDQKGEHAPCPLSFTALRQQMIDLGDLVVRGAGGRIRLQADRLLLLIRPKASSPPHHTCTLVPTIAGGH